VVEALSRAVALASASFGLASASLASPFGDVSDLSTATSSLGGAESGCTGAAAQGRSRCDST
jgi:hypothetical protein